ncbi:unnamed protein product [Sphagnum jensenii]|uniref:Uncharacterized protein n=1 Tax=Sphagnum jensenii TaxID=128206 RepID=A0ABP1B824_9BRYO
MLKALQNDGLQNNKFEEELADREHITEAKTDAFVSNYKNGVKNETDMTDSKGNNTPEQGADTGVWLALQPPGAPSGKFWGERHELAF